MLGTRSLVVAVDMRVFYSAKFQSDWGPLRFLVAALQNHQTKVCPTAGVVGHSMFYSHPHLVKALGYPVILAPPNT